MALLQIKNLEKSYGDSQKILKGVSLDVEKGGSCCDFGTIWLWKVNASSLHKWT